MSYFDDNEDRLTGLTGRIPRDDSWLLNPRLLAGTSQGIRNLLGIKKTMQIQIINIATTEALTKANKPYTVVEATFKNLSFQGKVEAKKIMPFGENSNAHKALINAQNGDVFDVQVVKNSAGYNDWVAVTPGVAGSPSPTTQSVQPAQTAGRVLPASSAASAPARTSTYETPEERAKKQVYIVRQSSLSAAIATLGAGAKSALKPSDVIAVAKEYEAFVFDTAAAPADDTGFDDMTDDVPY